jgi:hypothetical protein
MHLSQLGYEFKNSVIHLHADLRIWRVSFQGATGRLFPSDVSSLSSATNIRDNGSNIFPTSYGTFQTTSSKYSLLDSATFLRNHLDVHIKCWYFRLIQL